MDDERIILLAKKYKSQRDPMSKLKDALHNLYSRYIKERERTLLDAAAASTAVDALFLSDQIDYSQLTPQMEEAFHLAYPNVELGSLVARNPEEVEGFLSAWKGKYFEVLVRDRLNSGELVGDINLGSNQVAQLAESATQPGWDLQILNADGTIAKELQLKATDSLSYVKKALERYPDIEILATDEVSDAAASLSNQLFSSGISDKTLEDTIQKPMEALLDSPLEELLEDVLPFLPFVIIAIGEGPKVMVGRKTFELAVTDGLERAVKTGAAIGVGTLVVLLDGGLLSIPVSLLTRIGFDRYRIVDKITKRMNSRINSTRVLLPVYSE